MDIERDPAGGGLICFVSAAEQEAMNAAPDNNGPGDALYERLKRACESYERVEGIACNVTMVIRDVDAGGTGA